MAYTKRFDNRKFDEMRPIKAKVGVIEKADGSAMFQIGKTIAIAAVYGPRELHPRFKQNSKRAVLRCKYDMASFSVTERARPGPSRRSKELGYVMESALMPSLILEDFPKTVVDVVVEVFQADAGTRCAAISAASMALADAGIPMKDLVASVAVGQTDKKLAVDLSKKEEDLEATDIPIAYLPNQKQITLLQLDGSINKADFLKAVKMGIKACEQVHEIQKKALREKYNVGGK